MAIAKPPAVATRLQRRLGPWRSRGEGIDKYGFNADVDTAAEEDIWSQGGDWVPPAAAVQHNIASDSSDDDAGGSGLLTVDIYGLNANYAEASERVTLNGVADVLTTNAYWIIYRMIGRSGDVNVGNITATTDDSAATVTAAIPAGFGQTQMAVYQVPADKTAKLNSWHASINRNVTTGAADIFLKVKPPGEVWQVKAPEGLVAGGASRFHRTFSVPVIITPKSLVKVSAQVSANDTNITAGFELELY